MNMKFAFYFSVIAFFILPLSTFCQTTQLTEAQYDSLKQNGLLNTVTPYEVIANPLPNPSPLAKKKYKNIPGKSSWCLAYTPADASFTLPFGPTDDMVSDTIYLPFTFCFYGQPQNKLFISSNGLVTFDTIFNNFTPVIFPTQGFRCVAPFWADNDTGDNLNPIGTISYKISPTHIKINYDSVGYYDSHGDKRNSYQLILTDGVDPIVQGGNAAFLYADMQWTSGDLSNGTNGLNGLPAIMGMNKGDGVESFTVGEFDHEGTDFDGAGGSADGVSFLDNQSFYLNVCDPGNVPPVPSAAAPCDTFTICAVGDTADFPLIFLSPEENQTTSIDIDFGGLTSIDTILNTSGNVAKMIVRAWGLPTTVGTYNITVTATDNNTPTPGVTSFAFVLIIDNSGTIGFNPVLDQSITCDSATLTVLNGPFDSYLWSTVQQDSSIKLYESDTISVTVERNGCYKKITEIIDVPTSID